MPPRRIIGKSPAANRRLAPDDWPERESPIDLPDRDGECAGCAALQIEVNALRAEVETLTGALRDHQQMLADLNARLTAVEWQGVGQGRRRRRKADGMDAAHAAHAVL